MWSTVRPYKCAQDRTSRAPWQYASSWCYHDADSTAQFSSLSHLGHHCLSLWQDNARSFSCVQSSGTTGKNECQTKLRSGRSVNTKGSARSLKLPFCTEACCNSYLHRRVSEGPSFWTTAVLVLSYPAAKLQWTKAEVFGKENLVAGPHVSQIYELWFTNGCVVVDTTRHRQIQLGSGKTHKLTLVKKHPPTETSAFSITQKRLHPNRK